jgi:hypothetical protein
MLVTAQELDLSHASRIRMISIVIPSWTIKEAKALLRSKVPMDKWEDSFAVGVVELLELHPLAIIHAASYVTRNAYNTEQYLKEMQSLDMIKLAHQKNYLSNLLRRTSQGLDILMSISFAQIKKKKPRAIDLLFLIATLDSQGIPKTLLFRDGEEVRSFNAAIRVLKSFSLVTEDIQGESLIVHKLIHSWIQRKLKSEGL